MRIDRKIKARIVQFRLQRPDHICFVDLRRYLSIRKVFNLCHGDLALYHFCLHATKLGVYLFL